ncbi:MAG: hypothetical protein U1F09_00370 [Steroidobacteraceae bacterium]
MTNPYLQNVPVGWTRVGGAALLVAGAVLTALLVHEAADLVAHAESRRAFTSSSLIFGLIQLALCGMSWQAGYRLGFGKPDRSGMLFSRPAWFVIGTGFIVVTAVMAYAVFSARRPTLLDVQVLLFLGGVGVWCVVLALRRRRSE